MKTRILIFISISIALKGHADVVQYLISKGADPRAQTQDHVEPLHLAALTGHVSNVRVLLERDVDIRATTKNQTTAIHEAALRGYQSIIEEFLAKDPTAHVRPDYHLPCVIVLLNCFLCLLECNCSPTTTANTLCRSRTTCLCP